MPLTALVYRCLVFTLAACAIVPGSAGAAQADEPAVQYLVVPFENKSGDSRVHWLTEGSAILLTDDLQTMGVPAVSYEDRMLALERLRLPSVATFSLATTIQLGELAGATHAVLGSFTVEGETVTVRARTMDVREGRLSAEIVESGPVPDLFATYGRLVQRIVPGSEMTLEEMEAEHPAPAAFEQYVKGLLAQVPSTRVSYLLHARRLDPAFVRPRLALWRVYHEQSEHTEALAAVLPVPDDHRLFRRAQFLAAVSHINLAQYDEAFEILTALSQSMPDPALFNNLGVVQLRRSPPPSGARAVSYFGDALRLDAADADVTFNLGYAFLLDGDHAQAISWLREAVRRNPADGQAHYVLGAALQASGRAAEGAREKDLARRLAPDLASFEASTPESVPAGLERLQTDIDVPASLRVRDAIAESQTREQRETAAFHVASARRLAEDGRDTEAIAALQRATYLDPYDSDAHLLLGQLYLRGGRFTDAIDALTISIWSEDRLDAHLALAQAYVAAEDEASARTELELILERQPGHAEAQRLLDEL